MKFLHLITIFLLLLISGCATNPYSSGTYYPSLNSGIFDAKECKALAYKLHHNIRSQGYGIDATFKQVEIAIPAFLEKIGVPFTEKELETCLNS